MNQKTVRWQQRLQNLLKAYSQLRSNLAIEHPNDTEKQGIIQIFEFTYELSWKTLKDYLESNGITANYPREVFKQAFHFGTVEDGEIWLDMLAKRNLMSHTYNEKLAEQALDLIRNHYFVAITQLIDALTKKKDA